MVCTPSGAGVPFACPPVGTRSVRAARSVRGPATVDDVENSLAFNDGVYCHWLSSERMTCERANSVESKNPEENGFFGGSQENM